MDDGARTEEGQTAVLTTAIRGKVRVSGAGGTGAMVTVKTVVRHFVAAVIERDEVGAACCNPPARVTSKLAPPLTDGAR